LVIAFFAVQFLISVGPREIPRLEQTGIDAGVLGFTLGLSFLAAILFGIFPALRITRQRNPELLSSGRSYASDPGSSRGRNLLVVTAFALALLLFTGAGLLVRSYGACSSIGPRFQPQPPLTLSVPARGLPHTRC